MTEKSLYDAQSLRLDRKHRSSPKHRSTLDRQRAIPNGMALCLSNAYCLVQRVRGSLLFVNGRHEEPGTDSYFPVDGATPD